MFTTQFHVKEQGAAKPIHRRRRRQDESVLKKVLDIDRRFMDADSTAGASSIRIYLDSTPTTIIHHVKFCPTSAPQRNSLVA
jgi:hypothetical protein